MVPFLAAEFAEQLFAYSVWTQDSTCGDEGEGRQGFNAESEAQPGNQEQPLEHGLPGVLVDEGDCRHRTCSEMHASMY